jgi:cobalt-precorrin 5A hydrolase
LSVRAIATIQEKDDEPGLLALAEKLGVGIKFFTKEKLAQASTPSGPSETVFRNMGVYGVCEPAAMLAARSKDLLVHKEKSKNATIAVASARW